MQITWLIWKLITWYANYLIDMQISLNDLIIMQINFVPERVAPILISLT